MFQERDTVNLGNEIEIEERGLLLKLIHKYPELANEEVNHWKKWKRDKSKQEINT